MKCIQSIKATKHVEVGEIKRVSDKDADSEVKSKYWKYIPKNEWKTATHRPKTVNKQVVEKTPANGDESNDTNKKNKKTKK